MGAFNLFGKIASLIQNENANISNLIENIHYNMISVILHINDESQAVRKTCINCLTNICILFDINRIK